MQRPPKNTYSSTTTLLYVLLIVICYIVFSWGKGNDRHSDGRHSRKHWLWVDTFFFSLDFLCWGMIRNKSGSNASQPAGSHETLRVWCREVMLGSLLTLLDDGFLMPLHSSPPIVGSSQCVMFAGFGKTRDLHDSFIWLWCQECLCLGTRCGWDPLKENASHSFPLSLPIVCLYLFPNESCGPFCIKCRYLQ